MRSRTIFAAAGLAVLGLVGRRVEAQATTKCKDGTTSTSSGKGTCSGQRGVDAQATQAAKKASPSAKPGAQVTCTDGTLSKPGRGACSGHGGVKKTDASPSLPASVPASSPARTKSEAKSKAPTKSAATKSKAPEKKKP